MSLATGVPVTLHRIFTQDVSRMMRAITAAVRLPIRAGRRLRRQIRETHVVQRRNVAGYMAAYAVRKLHLGAGAAPLEGWLNTDLVAYYPGVIFMDASKPFPIPDASFDYVYGEHLIEHLALPDAVRMLAECSRILRRGGRVRFATPPLEVITALYSTSATEMSTAQRECLEWSTQTWPPDDWRGAAVTSKCLVINALFRQWGHQFLYDRASLEGMLRQSGFETSWYAMGSSEDAALRHIEQHGRLLGNEAMVAFTTMCLEGTKL